jgi:hypothetical protein
VAGHWAEPSALAQMSVGALAAHLARQLSNVQLVLAEPFGPAASAARELREQLATEPANRVVLIPWGPWSLTLDDMLITRIMEIAVHGDDLAYSVGLPGLQLPEAVADIATGLLVRLAVRRSGQAAVLRALARQERAPQSIAAF